MFQQSMEKCGLVDGGLECYGNSFAPLSFQVPGYVEIRREELRNVLLKNATIKKT